MTICAPLKCLRGPFWSPPGSDVAGPFWDLAAIQKAWREQAAAAGKTYAEFIAARDAAMEACGSDEVVVGEEHFAALRRGDWFIRLDRHFDGLEAVAMDGTGVAVHPKIHLRTLDFTLTGEAKLIVVDDEVMDLARLFPGASLGQRKFARSVVTIPRDSLPAFMSSHFLVGGSDGHRLAPTVPVSFETYWKKKVDGYSKYGPTFVQSLDSFSLSSNPKVLAAATP